MKFTSHSSRSLLPFYTGGALKPKPSSHFFTILSIYKASTMWVPFSFLDGTKVY